MTQLEYALSGAVNGDLLLCTMCGKFCSNDVLRGMFHENMIGTDKKVAREGAGEL